MDNPNSMQEIFKMAQSVAKNIDIPRNSDGTPNTNELDMNAIFKEVSKSVSSMVTPELVEKFNNKSEKKTSKIEINSDEDSVDELPKTRDLHFTLNVSLKHLYFGENKKCSS